MALLSPVSGFLGEILVACVSATFDSPMQRKGTLRQFRWAVNAYAKICGIHEPA